MASVVPTVVVSSILGVAVVVTISATGKDMKYKYNHHEKLGSIFSY